MSDPKPFLMTRNHDESGVSRTGVVLEGVVFGDGTCVTRWRSPTPSTNMWSSFDAFKTIHIDSHPTNGTEIAWL